MQPKAIASARIERWHPGLGDAAGLALPVLVAMWAVLIRVFLTNPIRPYATGGLLEVDLLFYLMAGVLIGLGSRPWAAVVGITIGIAGAVGVQLFVLASQAGLNAQVLAHLPEPPWSGQITVAVVLTLLAMWLGSGVGIAVRRGLRMARRGVVSPDPHPRGWTPVGIAVVVIALVATGAVVEAAANSPYVAAATDPTLHLEVADGRIVNLGPADVAAGRSTVNVEWADGADAFVGVAGPVADADRPRYARGGSSFELPLVWTAAPDRGLGRVELVTPGTYAVVLVSLVSVEDHDIGMAILDSAFFDVTGPPDATGFSGRASVFLQVGAGTAVIIAGLAGGGAVAHVRRRRWLDRGWTVRETWLALLGGAANAGAVAFLALFAIDLSHNPF